MPLGIFLAGQISVVFGQTVPVTFHFDPPVDNFQIVRLVGSFNGWNNADNNLTMTDPDGDGVFTLTTPLALGVVHNYKFCLDADWGQAFTDPDNPQINLSDNNNSIITVTDPNVTYLLPRDITTAGDEYVDVSDNGEPIRAIIDNTAGNPIDLDNLEVLYDSVALDNPGQYFNAAGHEFLYQLPTTPETGEHTITLTVSSANDTITRSSTYRYDPSLIVYHVPTDFYFDTHNSRNPFFTGSINSVSLMGVFNNWNNQFNPMQDSDGDGVWETTAMLEPHGWEYKFQINHSLWTSDYDNPHFNPDNADNNWVVVTLDSVPSLKLLTPKQSQIFINDGALPASIDLNALLRPGILGDGVDEGSVYATLNGNALDFSFNSETGIVSASGLDLGPGVNTLEIGFSNGKGMPASQLYTFGLYEPNTGYHFVDAFNDVQYFPPAGIDPADLDIHDFHIEAVGEGYDQLHFIANMGGISDRTRLGLLITDPVNATAEDPLELELELPDWNGEGVFAILADPSSTVFNATRENVFQESRDPVVYGNHTIDLNTAALSENQFDFILPLAYLDSLLGGWNQQRVFLLFSYLAAEDGSANSTEVTGAQGGIDEPEDPDIYDAAFVRSGFWQNRILSNFIPDNATNGPRLTALDGSGRGQAILTSNDISDSLATFGPVITFLTPDVTYWYGNVPISWTVDDTLVATSTLTFNGVDTLIAAVDGIFTYNAILQEGDNVVSVRAVGSNGFATTSNPHILTYTQNHDPSVYITIETAGRVMTLTAHGSSPDSLNLSYLWWSDLTNPASISILPFSYTSITRTIPAANGAYYFNVRAKDSENRTATARCYITANDSGIIAGGLQDHAAWIDSAIFYEIYPRSFSEQGGFTGIMDRIPDMLDLGINAVWLMPIFEGPTTHGYEITDYYHLEQDYGTEAEFEDLVSTLHENGIHIILDFVVNHTGIGHPFIQNVFQYHEYSPWANWYIWDGEPGNSNYEYYFDWASLPNLNHVNPDVRHYFINVAKYWVNHFDIDGYRCDVAWGVQDRSSLFWPEWRAALKNIKPEVFLEAEASSAESVFYDQRFDSANDWELRSCILEALQGTNTLDALDAELRRNYPVYARPFRFLENHDEARMASSYDTQRSKLAHTIVLMANGVPLIYSGGEVGELTGRGLIDWSDPENIRPYFQRLVEIRKTYIHNPEIQRVTNSAAIDIYSFASISDSQVVVTVANFNAAANDLTLDLSSLPMDGNGPYFLSDLISGEIIQVDAGDISAVPVSLNSYQARVFYFGSDVVSVRDSPGESGKIADFRLEQNYPNPFNPSTAIQYILPSNSMVNLVIYDITGREVTRLVQTSQTAGDHQIFWNGRNSNQGRVASGVYFYRLEARDTNGKLVNRQTRRMMLIK